MIGWKSMLLPALAVASVGVATLLHFKMPRASTIEALGHKVAALQAQIALVSATPIPAQDDHQEQLPKRLCLGEVVQVIEARARRAGIQSLSIATEAKQSAPAPVHTSGGPSMAPPGSTAKDAAPVELVDAEKLECKLETRSGFQELVRLLGMLESGSPLMRVRDLRIKPDGEGVRAEIALVTFWYPGRKDQAAPAAPGK